MPLNIETFRNDLGGSAVYKALSHPLAAEHAQSLLARLEAAQPVAIYDPDSTLSAFDTFYPLAHIPIAATFVQNVERIGTKFRGLRARPITELSGINADSLLIASFDEERARKAIGHLIPKTSEVFSLAALKLPLELQTDRTRYLAALNFATNFAFFRDEGGRHTRLVTANYWARYGAKNVTFWCRLYAGNGDTLATWTQECSAPEASIVIDSADIRARFSLPAFTGQLFLHATGVAGHDVVKYALDTYGDDPAVLSTTHDANSWPSDLYAGLPAPAAGEDVILWVQNSHPIRIGPNEIGLRPMGGTETGWLTDEISPFATHALSVRELLPEIRWPRQIEIIAGKHIVRPRYEIVAAGGRTRIAHPNVERSDLSADANLARLQNLLGKGHILPAPILPLDTYASTMLPTPMSTAQTRLPIKALIYDANGVEVAQHRFGDLPRDHAQAMDISAAARGKLTGGFGHLELVYDFEAGTEADGWLHALFRYVDTRSGHAAETSFGSHIFNTALTYRGEPQSYSGPPPGLSTRLFLRIAPTPLETLCHLIYPVSDRWRPRSATRLILRNAAGEVITEVNIAIPASGSMLVNMRDVFGDGELARAGRHATVIVRDETCRLFGYHATRSASGGSFSLDHMFGF
jgi:hypothetical protein